MLPGQDGLTLREQEFKSLFPSLKEALLSFVFLTGTDGAAREELKYFYYWLGRQLCAVPRHVPTYDLSKQE